MTQTDWPDFYAWLLRTYWDALAPEARLAVPSEDVAPALSIPEDIWRSALLMYPDPMRWLNNPIPNLKGRTPLELIAADETDAIRAIIQDIAPFMLPSPEDVTPWRPS